MTEKTETETKLRECPFCDGSRGVPMLASIRASGLEWWYVECEDCNAHGPELGGPDEAIAAWNTRPTPDAAEREGLVEELDAAMQQSGYYDEAAVEISHDLAKRILTALRTPATPTPNARDEVAEDAIVDAAETRAERAEREATEAPHDQAGVDELRTKLRNVISHASGGSMTDHADCSLNAICVGISRHHNMIWEQAQKSVLRTDTGKLLAENEGRPLADIAAERTRQVTEGWTPEHDDKHHDGTLAKAAACYAVGYQLTTPIHVRNSVAGEASVWPWDDKWWKPGTDRRRRLIKAGALIVAEIERLDRAALTDTAKGEG